MGIIKGLGPLICLSLLFHIGFIIVLGPNDNSKMVVANTVL
jgi:hypothetical protein